MLWTTNHWPSKTKTSYLTVKITAIIIVNYLINAIAVYAEV
ncbi:putative membrane protein [Microcystis aeruginosa TAIHU98]|uniref:Uncharacterized protein n=2 Tax=Microcystis aeruginosa TaxID=1126 RepID=A0AB33BPK8_MICA7|nr:hypothetical protein BH695_2808 [Microcystis aeruginosa PCC 7806SL]ELP52277.1 putative membrane protein [Microcystis aeruginosa TAIHU98]